MNGEEPCVGRWVLGQAINVSRELVIDLRSKGRLCPGGAEALSLTTWTFASGPAVAGTGREYARTQRQKNYRGASSPHTWRPWKLLLLLSWYGWPERMRRPRRYRPRERWDKAPAIAAVVERGYSRMCLPWMEGAACATVAKLERKGGATIK